MPSTPEQQEYAREWLVEFLVTNGVDPEIATARVAKYVTEFSTISDGRLLIKSGDRFFPAAMGGSTSPYWEEFGRVLLRTAPRKANAGAPGESLTLEELVSRKRASGRYAG